MEPTRYEAGAKQYLLSQMYIYTETKAIQDSCLYIPRQNEYPRNMEDLVAKFHDSILVEGHACTITLVITTIGPIDIATITSQLEGAVVEDPYLVAVGEAQQKIEFVMRVDSVVKIVAGVLVVVDEHVLVRVLGPQGLNGLDSKGPFLVFN